MKWEESQAIKIVITDVKSLDPVTVYIENYGDGRGKLLVEVFGESWSAYWGGMGTRNLEDFVLSCDNHYLSKNLSTLADLSEEDYEGFINKCRSEIIEERRDFGLNKLKARERWEKVNSIEPEKEWFHDSSNHSLLSELMGSEWWYSIPNKDSGNYKYLCRILDALKACLKERKKAQEDGAVKGDEHE